MTKKHIEIVQSLISFSSSQISGQHYFVLVFVYFPPQKLKFSWKIWGVFPRHVVRIIGIKNGAYLHQDAALNILNILLDIITKYYVKYFCWIPPARGLMRDTKLLWDISSPVIHSESFFFIFFINAKILSFAVF